MLNLIAYLLLSVVELKLLFSTYKKGHYHLLNIGYWSIPHVLISVILEGNCLQNNVYISHKLYVEKITYMSNDEPYRCNVCGNMTFNSREELDKHNREKHETSTLWLNSN